MVAMSEGPQATATDATTPSAEKTTMDIQEIMSILPHRYPFLLIDRIVEMERGKRIVAIKNVTANEPQFTGHFPDYPIMPGVLTIEAMAQAGGALLLTEYPDRSERLMVFTGIEQAKFRRPIVPGDQVRIEVTVLSWRPKFSKIRGVATVEGQLAADATLTCALLHRERPSAKTGEAPTTQAPQ